MPVLLFRLKHVPEDEADQIRHLLHDNGIDYYETPPGRWGISVHGIWIRDSAQEQFARSLLEDFHRDYGERLRAQSEQSGQGTWLSAMNRIKHEPLKFILVLGFVLFILYVTLVPFLKLAGYK